MNLGKYEIETYYVVVNGQTETRQRVVYTGLNEEDIFIERYYGSIREGYRGSNTFFKDLEWIDIRTHIVGESIVINDNSSPPKPQIYLSVSSIESVQREGDINLIIYDNQSDPINLKFVSKYDCDQAYSVFSYVLQNHNVDIDSIINDITPPTIFFNEYFFAEQIKLDGSDLSGPFSTNDGSTFRVDINFSTFEGPNPITRSDIGTGLIYSISDNRDGEMNLTEQDFTIYKDVINVDNIVDEISSLGIYLCKFYIQDLGQNQNNSTVVFSIT
jgi:hypothetical protein